MCIYFNYKLQRTVNIQYLSDDAKCQKKKDSRFFFFQEKKCRIFLDSKLVNSSLGTNRTLTLIHGQLSNKKIGSSFIRAQKCGRQPFLRKNHLLATITKEQTCFLSKLLMNCNHFDSPWAYFCHLFAKAFSLQQNTTHRPQLVPTNFSVFEGQLDHIAIFMYMPPIDKCFSKNELNIGYWYLLIQIQQYA